MAQHPVPVPHALYWLSTRLSPADVNFTNLRCFVSICKSRCVSIDISFNLLTFALYNVTRLDLWLISYFPITPRLTSALFNTWFSVICFERFLCSRQGSGAIYSEPSAIASRHVPPFTSARSCRRRYSRAVCQSCANCASFTTNASHCLAPLTATTSESRYAGSCTCFLLIF